MQPASKSVPVPEAKSLPKAKPAHAFRASPNHGERVGGGIDMLLLHYTGMPDCKGAIDRLCDPAAEVSAHYVVQEDGAVVQLVDETRRAWHAGRASWAGVSDINSRSIGIEICNPGHDGGMPPYPARQIEGIITLCKGIIARHGIYPERVLGHSDVAPDRKADPGETFPWDRLAAAGIGHYVPPEPISNGRYFMRGDEGQPVSALQTMLGSYGYTLRITGVYDEPTERVIAAFQRHFRPALVDGIADASTLATLHKLIKALPARGDFLQGLV